MDRHAVYQRGAEKAGRVAAYFGFEGMQEAGGAFGLMSRIDASLYSPEMNPSLVYDHDSCPVCGAIDKPSAQRRCVAANGKKVEACGWSRRLVSVDVNGYFCRPVTAD